MANHDWSVLWSWFTCEPCKSGQTILSSANDSYAVDIFYTVIMKSITVTCDKSCNINIHDCIKEEITFSGALSAALSSCTGNIYVPCASL